MSRRMYTHDCDRCVSIGVFGETDLYYCAQNGDPTVIARFGNDGPDYTSGMVFADRGHPLLAEAKARAIAKGLYAEKTA